jgi:zinc ribbon protein
VRCPRCGNENSEENRFCGMCGTKLLPTPAAVTSAPAGNSAPVTVASTSAQTAAMRSSTPPSAAAPVLARPQSATAPRSSAPVPQDSPVISGPSFLGLSDPAPRTRASLGADSHSNSRNLDYLLEDEEEHRGSAGKFFLILLALALAVGFGYLRWKNQGLPWLHLGPTKPAAAAQNSDSTDTTAPPSPATSEPSTTPPAQSTTSPAQPAAQSEAQPATQTAAQPAPDSSSASAPAAANPPATPDTANPPAATAPATGDATTGAGDAPNSSPKSATAPPAAAAKEPAKESAPAAPDTPPPPTPKPKAAAPTPKPRAGFAPSTLADPVSEAQKYIYGRGVVQDCERGMRILKPAAAQANPKAMIEMGALYSAGLCTPHDLPTAYRWFAMALRKDPNNQSVQADLQKLWSEMTQPERQLAIKLSQ